MTDPTNNPPEDVPASGRAARISRAALAVASGVIPLAGGFLSAIAGAWSEADQERINRVFEAWIRMLQDELKEKAQTIFEVMARLDLQDEAIAARSSRSSRRPSAILMGGTGIEPVAPAV